jgi:presequence protease
LQEINLEAAKAAAAKGGFTILDARYVPEVSSRVYRMVHDVSGARLLFLANEDDNKVFNIGFRTPPSNDTGVAHIMEHSTLCGSRKYHVKEPFVELVKGSLNTFLNAMTYPDKTVYPVASRNDKDFRNLMDVYLDAVFYPNLRTNPYALKQEGWHYEMETPDDPLVYNGVVYNEMKGVYSAPDALLEYYGKKNLFPDTTYRFESGGLPEAIPNLTQEAFVQFHQTFYSPENSYIYLYGDMDMADTLAYLDTYLRDFPRTGRVHSDIPLQAPFEKTREWEGTYSVPSGEDKTGKTFHEVQFVVSDMRDLRTTFAMKLLESVLLESESAPLRRALLDAGVAADISGSFSGSMRQPVFGVRASGSEPDQKEKFIKALYHNLQKISREGIDKELLESTLNATEFKLRESDFGAYPKGLIYGLDIMDSWIYNVDPIQAMSYETLLKDMRAAIGTRYFEQLIETNLLDNTHRVILTLAPEPGKEEREQAAQAKELAALKTTLPAAELERYCQECAELHRRQGTPDTPENLESIPLLRRQDIRKETECLSVEEEQVGGGTLLYQELPTHKIVYLNWYFDVTGLPPEYLPYCSLLSDVLGKLNTDTYSYADLSKYTNMHTGGIDLNFVAMGQDGDPDKYTLSFVVKAKCLSRKLPELFRILRAFSLHTQFDDKERLKELIGQLKTDWDNNFFERGQSVALTRLGSYFSACTRVTEQDYYSYYVFLKDLTNHLDERLDETYAKLRELAGWFFNKTRYVLSYGCEAGDREAVRAAALAYAEELPESPVAGRPAVPFPAPGHNEAIATAGKVQYVTAGGDFHKHGFRYTGAMLVLATMLRYEYLWTHIRVQGGAYGANATFDRSGTLVLSTYRDPQLLQSLQVFAGLPDWLRKVSLSEREMTKYVIGTMSGVDVPLTNSVKVSQAAIRRFWKVTDAMRQQTRDEILQVTPDDIRALADVVAAVLADKNLCVVGGQAAIDGAKDVFETIRKA